MNNLYSFLSLVFLIFCNSLNAQKNTSVSIHGVAKNFNNQIQIEDMSEMGDLTLPNSERTFATDSNRNFSISFSLQKPSYFRFGRNILYLSPGDSLNVSTDFNNPEKASFSGKGSNANDYLKCTPFPKAGSFLEAGDKVKPSFKETVKEILSSADKRKYQLNQVKRITNGLRQLEQARITADIINSLLDIQAYFPDVNHIPADSIQNFKREYETYVRPIIKRFTKEIGFKQSFLQLKVYRDIIPSILTQDIINTNEVKKIRSWLHAVDFFEQFFSLKEKKDISFFQKQIDSISVQQYKSALIKTYQTIMEFRDGDEAINFEMLDMNNQKVLLTDFKGKLIYIDLWATWCGPCIEEMPFLNSLQGRYKNNPNIVFISLSIDNNKESWLNFLSQKQLNNHQYIIDRKKLEKYNVVSVPRTIIINKLFKVEALDAGLPSAKETAELLEKLLSK